MTLYSAQESQLQRTVEWAIKLREALGALQDAHGDRVHFRPASTGVAMVGLLADRPQRGKSGITNLNGVVDDFESMFATNCRDISHGRVTGEKALQSYLIRDAYTNQRRMVSINARAKNTNAPVELWFVTDEIAMPTENSHIVCDVLALRRDGGRSTPVLLELKDSRKLTEIVKQVECYSTMMDEHETGFADLYEALLGEPVQFDGPTEKWIVWPAEGLDRDPREDELWNRGIRTVGYKLDTKKCYRLRVGRGRGV